MSKTYRDGLNDARIIAMRQQGLAESNGHKRVVREMDALIETLFQLAQQDALNTAVAAPPPTCGHKATFTLAQRPGAHLAPALIEATQREFVCDRVQGHSEDHMAHDERQNMLAWWAR